MPEFPRELLTPDEECVLDVKPHWWTLVPPVIFVLGVLVALVLLRDVHEYINYLLYALFVVAIIGFVANYIRREFTRFVITTERLIYRTGIIAKHSMEIPLTRVTNIAFNQSIFERLLRMGDLLIESAGEGGQQVFFDIENPAQVQNLVYRQMDNVGERESERDADKFAESMEDVGNHGTDSIPGQIEKLSDLHQRGIITKEQYELKKSQLLERM